MIFSRLLAYQDQAEGDSTIYPDLAEALPEQPDPQTIVFKLNPNARWHDHEPLNARPVTAEDVKFSIEPKPNEPRGDLYLPCVGSVLAFAQTLDHPEMVGTNPEIAHVKMAGLNPYHEFAQALDAGKLLDVHLNDQKPLRFDQDLSFGSDSFGWYASRRLPFSIAFASWLSRSHPAASSARMRSA